MSKPILLIDDEEKFALMLQELLQISGYEADYCLNPEEALARLRHETYDLVITDYKMPQMDGSQFLQAARKINPDMPVIMISGLMNMPELIKVANIGVTLVLEKPFKTEDLLEYVARFVRKSADIKATAEAMDMEASEISFQQETVKVTYPSPAKFISDASIENKRFLEVLWNSANGCRHLPFYAQRGAEVRLVAREVMDWTDHDPEGEVVRIDLADTGNEITRSWVNETESFPGALLVDLRDSEWNETTRKRLAEWVEYVEECEKDTSMSRLLYVLPTGSRFSLEELPLPEEHRSLFSADCPVLLSLRERLLDTATYISRAFDEAQKKALGRNNLVRLLHHPWQGGYQELHHAIEAIKSDLEARGSLTFEEINILLTGEAEETSFREVDLDLSTYLKRRQREYILLHRKDGEELKETILRLGIDSDSVSVEEVLRNEALAFPSVVI